MKGFDDFYNGAFGEKARRATGTGKCAEGYAGAIGDLALLATGNMRTDLQIPLELACRIAAYIEYHHEFGTQEGGIPEEHLDRFNELVAQQGEMAAEFDDEYVNALEEEAG